MRMLSSSAEFHRLLMLLCCSSMKGESPLSTGASKAKKPPLTDPAVDAENGEGGQSWPLKTVRRGRDLQPSSKRTEATLRLVSTDFFIFEFSLLIGRFRFRTRVVQRLRPQRLQIVQQRLHLP